MSRRLLSVFGLTATLALAACSSGGATNVPSQGAASEAPASEPASEPPASAAAGGACTASTGAPTVDVTVEGFAFPATVDAKVGDVIGFTNKDSAPHTATLDDDSCTTENIATDATGSLTFGAAGDYPYHCKIHPNMVGTIKVSG
ncbi:MAG: cupredoxin domain-containing protein [Candidatus Limnocylindrales bacterium]